jgi:hypothetical protein
LWLLAFSPVSAIGQPAILTGQAHEWQVMRSRSNFYASLKSSGCPKSSADDLKAEGRRVVFGRT